MNNTSVKISIITATFNAEKYIEETILSVLNQSYLNKELLIIDGGSSDNTLKIINKYINKIDFLVSEPDKGIYDAMNKGISNANGDWIFFLNAGDLFNNNMVLEKIFTGQIVEKKLIYGKTLNYSELNHISYISGKEIVIENIYFKIQVSHQSIFFRTLEFKKLGFFDIKYTRAADHEWLVRFFKNYSKEDTIFIDEIISNYMIEGEASNMPIKTYYEKLLLCLNHTKNKKIIFKAYYIFFIKLMKHYLLSPFKKSVIYYYLKRIKNENSINR